MNPRGDKPLPRRVDELEVAGVLALLNGVKETRDRPLAGDLEGEFDSWFDGGAIRVITGYLEYFFRNGAYARVTVLPKLCLRVRLPDGHTVWIEQDDEPQ